MKTRNLSLPNCYVSSTSRYPDGHSGGESNDADRLSNSASLTDSDRSEFLRAQNALQRLQQCGRPCRRRTIPIAIS